jgi:hypothetical protein
MRARRAAATFGPSDFLDCWTLPREKTPLSFAPCWKPFRAGREALLRYECALSFQTGAAYFRRTNPFERKARRAAKQASGADWNQEKAGGALGRCARALAENEGVRDSGAGPSVTMARSPSTWAAAARAKAVRTLAAQNGHDRQSCLCSPEGLLWSPSWLAQCCDIAAPSMGAIGPATKAPPAAVCTTNARTRNHVLNQKPRISATPPREVASLAAGPDCCNCRNGPSFTFCRNVSCGSQGEAAHGWGRGVVATIGGRWGSVTSGWRPVSDFRKSAILPESSSLSCTPSWASAITSTAFFRSQTRPLWK